MYRTADEIQEVHRVLSSLKYFYENAPQYRIICAGSLLGIALHQGTSFPVGKVDFLKLCPLYFEEFLMATGRERGVLAGCNVVMPNLSLVMNRKQYELYDNKICTGDEAAECRGCMEGRMSSIGYHLVVDRGDCKPL